MCYKDKDKSLDYAENPPNKLGFSTIGGGFCFCSSIEALSSASDTGLTLLSLPRGFAFSM